MLKRNLIANYLAQGWIAVMGLAFIPLYIKYLGIEAYGLIGLFAALTAWLSLFDIGMTSMLGREMARFTGGNNSPQSIRDLLRSVEIIAIVIALLIAGGIAVGSNWIATSWLTADNLPVEVVAQALGIMGMVTALRFVENVYRSSIVGLQRQVVLSFINGAMATLRGLGAVAILAWLSPTIHAFFLWQGLLSILTLVILGATTYQALPQSQRNGRFSLDAMRGVWRFAGGIIGITFLALLLTQVDKILLSKLLSLSEYGFYTLATVVASALYQLIGPITTAFYPQFCKFYERREEALLIDAYHKGAQMVTVIAGSAAIVLMLYAKTFLSLWTQDAALADKVWPLLALLMLGTLLNGLMWVPYQTQLAHGWTSLSVKINLIAVTFIVPALLLIVPRYGAIGAAWVWAVLNSGYVFIGVHFMYRRILTREKWRWYIQDIFKPLAAAILVASSVYLFWPGSADNWLEQAVQLTLASLLTIASATWAAGLLRQEVLRHIRHVWLMMRQ